MFFKKPKKIRLIRTTIIEYEPEIENYPKGFSLKQMQELDLKNTRENPRATFNTGLLSCEGYQIYEKIESELI